jgi:hypothetical protein
VIGGNLDQDDPDAVGVLDPHLGQAPGLRGGLPDDRDAGRGQQGVLGADTTGAYAAWMASADTPADRRPLAETVHAADDTLTSALARVQERWGSDPAQWLTFGMTLAMSQRILAEVGRPLDPAEREPA